MSLFGGSGFLGLGGTKFGETATNIFEEGADFVGDATKFAVSLPNRLIDLGESLGNKTFDTSGETAQQFKKEAVEFKSRQAGANVGKSFSGVLNFLSNNILLVAGAVVLFFTLKD